MTIRTISTDLPTANFRLWKFFLLQNPNCSPTADAAFVAELLLAFELQTVYRGGQEKSKSFSYFPWDVHWTLSTHFFPILIIIILKDDKFIWLTSMTLKGALCTVHRKRALLRGSWCHCFHHSFGLLIRTFNLHSLVNHKLWFEWTANQKAALYRKAPLI